MHTSRHAGFRRVLSHGALGACRGPGARECSGGAIQTIKVIVGGVSGRILPSDAILASAIGAGPIYSGKLSRPAQHECQTIVTTMKLVAEDATKNAQNLISLPSPIFGSKTHSQSQQALAPGPGEYFPAEHGAQGSRPIDAEYLPAPQDWHIEGGGGYEQT
jgi:hypothetical protein